MKSLVREFNEFLGESAILVVEPAANYRASIKQFLTNLKARNIKMCSSSAEAKREMLTTKVGLFIVEWKLAEQNGIQFCRELRQERHILGVPFLLLSVENLRSDVILASEVGITGYLLKPFSYEDFCDQIAHIVKTKHHKTSADELLEKGDELLVAGKFVEAENYFKSAIEENPSSARALCGLAKVAKATDRDRDALKLLQKAVEINPDYIEAYREFVRIYQDTGDLEGLIKAAAVMHSMSPDNPKYTLILAAAYLGLNQLDSSEQFFSITVRLSPQLAEAYRGLGNVYIAKQDYERAMKNYQKALDLDKDDISTLNSLGLTYVRQGMIKEGVKRYLMALKLDPHNAKVLFNMGQAYEKMGNFTKAKLFYGRSLTSDPEFEKAKRCLERATIAAQNGDAKSEQPPNEEDTPEFDIEKIAV